MTATTETPFALNAHFVALNNELSNHFGEVVYVEDNKNEKKLNKIIKDWYLTIKTEYKNYLETNKISTKNYVKNLDEKITEIKNIIIDWYVNDELTDENQEKLIAVGIEFEEEEEEIELCKGCGECDGEEQYDWYCEECRAENLGHYKQATEVDEETDEDEDEDEAENEIIYIDNGLKDNAICNISSSEMSEPVLSEKRITIKVKKTNLLVVEPEPENIYIDNGLKDNAICNISSSEMSELDQLKKRVAELEADNKEKERQQKIAENKTEWFEKQYPEWIQTKSLEWQTEILEFMEKKNIPDIFGINGGDIDAYGTYYLDEEQKINTYVTDNECLVKQINKAIGFRPKEEKKTDTKRATPKKICRDSDKLFNDGEVLKHTATKDKIALNHIYCYYDKTEDKFELCSVVFNMLNEIVTTNKLGHTFKNLNQFIIYNNKQYAPEKVQKETAWNGSVKLCRNKVWINTKDLEPL
jgi:hypothetical protein